MADNSGIADRSMRHVTVFDFDGTLTLDDTFFSFGRHCLGLPRMLRGIAATLPWIIGWKLGLTSNSRAKEKLFSALYRGRSRSCIEKAAQTFTPRFNRAVLDKLSQSIQRGDTVYIISASLDLWMERMAAELGTRLCCTATATDSQGLVTGRFSSPNCHGQEKVNRLLAVEPDRRSYHLTVYGDSNGDAALLAIADTPCLVARN
ncbi:MAG: haloacid dehalogenase-like hydrolase [Muribaculaceae bacterium]|nr:haloacid dehalogenase-like hydrolase [Muribaculaceae bacterium]